MANTLVAEDRTSPYVLEMLVHHIGSCGGRISSRSIHVLKEDGVEYIRSRYRSYCENNPTLRLYPSKFSTFYYEYSVPDNSWVCISARRGERTVCREEEVEYYARQLTEVN